VNLQVCLSGVLLRRPFQVTSAATSTSSIGSSWLPGGFSFKCVSHFPYDASMQGEVSSCIAGGPQRFFWGPVFYPEPERSGLYRLVTAVWTVGSRGSEGLVCLSRNLPVGRRL